MKRTATQANNTSQPPKKHIKIPERKLKNATARHAHNPLWRLDWPAETGPIDLAVQDLPHDSADTEWWYLNSHLKTASGHEYSIFVAFFLITRGYNEKTEVAQYAHALTWAISDVTNGEYYNCGLVDPDACNLILTKLNNHSNTDKRINVALKEMLERGSVPLPDIAMDDDNLSVSTDKLYINYSGNTLQKDAQGRYHIHLAHPDKAFGVDLAFTPLKQAVRQGHDGLTHVGRKGEEMFYYFIPRHDVSGSLTVEGQVHNVAGSGWYDHEFGGTIRHKWSDDEDSSSSSSAPAPVQNKASVDTEFAWNWVCMQLDDGHDLTATYLYTPGDNQVVDQYTITIAPDSSRQLFKNMTLVPTAYWDSVRTYQKFPIAWKLTAPEAGIDMDIKAAFEDQEFMTLISEPSFWEGRTNVTGTLFGKPITGKGYIEIHGFQTLKKLDSFLKAVSTQVEKQIDRIIPLDASREHLLETMGGKGFEHYIDGLSEQVYIETVVKPLREIVDRGGKAWRSYSCLLCMDCVGGDSRKHPEMLAMPELMHVGSLIIDDIQDKSETRRGGPSCHKIYGDAIAINAGNAAYFLSQFMMRSKKLPAEQKLRLYEIYFQALRAGHVGQGADIHGLYYLMPEAVAKGGDDAKKLLSSVCATHRLKSAAPAGALARMGGIMGNGSEQQIDKLGLFFEALGIAFQIMDDVLNLRGMRSGKQALKVLGEDIMEGKITYPVARGVTCMDEQGRKWLWETVSSCPKDPEVVGKVIKALEDCGALEASVTDATTMVDDAWNALSPVLPDSFYKAMLRAFSFFVLDRHY